MESEKQPRESAMHGRPNPLLKALLAVVVFGASTAASFNYVSSMLHPQATVTTSTTTPTPQTTISSTQSPTTTMATTTYSTSLLATSLHTTSSTLSTTMGTTSILQSQNPSCQTHDFLRVNESLYCPPVKLTLVDVGMGNSRYQIANAIVDIYMNGSLIFMNESLLQSTSPYWFNFSNGHNVEIYVYQATYAIYPVYRSANISVAYR